jgi:hypothetical protein
MRRASAEKAWEELSPDEELTEVILSAVKAQAESADWQREGGRYIPTASHWLEEKRWEDEIAPQPAPKDEGSFSTNQFFEAALQRTKDLYGIP